MTPFIDLPSSYRGVFTTWSIILVICMIENFVYTLRERKTLYSLLAGMTLLITYFQFQISLHISLWKMGGKLPRVVQAYGELPHALLLTLYLALTILGVVRFQRCVTYGLTHITPMSIKEAADELTAGLCYYNKDGQPFLVNHKMSELSFALTGNAIMNGNEFYNCIKDQPIVEMKDGTVFRFMYRELQIDGELFYELLADDVTTLYRKAERLKVDNERLREQNERMKEYGKSIDDTVRKEEILKTKTSIHDEMNRLLLATDHSIVAGTEEERKQVLDLWKKNILLLGIEADDKNEGNFYSDIYEIGRLIGIEPVFSRKPYAKDADTAHLMLLACEEAMTNAVKHAKAKHLYVDITEEDAMMQLDFTNDGKNPKQKPIEAGGLVTLRSHVENAGGTMEITDSPKYRMLIRIPKGEKENVL